jgi:hypothetical protein
MATMTTEQVKEMHTYLIKHHFYHRENTSNTAGTATVSSAGDTASNINADNVNGDDDDEYADDQYRLQLRCLMLMLCCCMGSPKLDELLSARHSDLKVYKCDLNEAEAEEAGVPPMGDSGTGPNNILMVGFGPDKNGKDIVFSTIEHRYPNECCVNALGDLLIYEQNKDPAGTKLLEWSTNPKAVSPFIFHKPGELATPISEEAVRRDLVAALTAVGAPPYVECIAEGGRARALQGGCTRDEVDIRTLASPKPAVSSEMLWLLKTSDFYFTIDALVKSSMQSAGWKLQSFGNDWPLAKLPGIQSRDFQKFTRKIMRHVNDNEGCTKCGTRRSAGVKLLKCSGCRTTLYCSVDCQKSHWKTHKPDCKRIFPTKR